MNTNSHQVAPEDAQKRIPLMDAQQNEIAPKSFKSKTKLGAKNASKLARKCSSLVQPSGNFSPELFRLLSRPISNTEKDFLSAPQICRHYKFCCCCCHSATLLMSPSCQTTELIHPTDVVLWSSFSSNVLSVCVRLLGIASIFTCVLCQARC